MEDSRVVKKGGIGCLGILALIAIIGFATHSGGGGSSTAPATPVTQASSAALPASASAAKASEAATATPAPTATPVPQSTATSAPKLVPPPTLKIYKVGETATLKDQKIVLNSVKHTGEAVKADLTITNTGAKSFTVSSLASFEARDLQGYKGSFNLDLSSSSTLDGDILPNDKLHGTLSYKFPAKAVGLKLYYAPDVFDGAAVVFALDKTAEQEPWPALPNLSSATPNQEGHVYKVGDLVKNGDLVLRLNKVSHQGTKTIADLTVYNLGSKSHTVSSIVSFEAKDADGTKGDYKMETGQGESLDGVLVPGDTLSGALAFAFPTNSKGIKLYFQNSFFGGDTVQFALSE